MKPDIFDWVFTSVFCIVFLGVLIFCDIAQRIAILFGDKAHGRALHLLDILANKSFSILGINLEIEQFGELKENLPYIIISNHQSLFDIPLLNIALPHLTIRYIAKKELGRFIPSISFNLRNGGSALINRSNVKQAIKAIEQLGQTMTLKGFPVAIFPEGTRSRDGELKKFRYAGLASLLQTAPTAQIVPVTIDGSWKLGAHNHKPIPRNITVRLVIGAPIARGDHESLKELVEEIHAITRNTLERLRQ